MLKVHCRRGIRKRTTANGQPPQPSNSNSPADFLPDNRVVFNIKHNKYRLIVRINYNSRTIFIRFVGTHAEYDKIDAEVI